MTHRPMVCVATRATGRTPLQNQTRPRSAMRPDRCHPLDGQPVISEFLNNGGSGDAPGGATDPALRDVAQNVDPVSLDGMVQW